MKKRVLLAGVVVLGLLQLARPDLTNPPTKQQNTLKAQVDVPPAVEQVFDRACADCHSHRTRWPWYSQVSPVSWFLRSHIREARQKMNLDDWTDEMSFKDVCQEARVGSMPLKSYLLMHPGAKLSGADVQTLCAWSQQASAH
jgi:hypothetical protein